MPTYKKILKNLLQRHFFFLNHATLKIFLQIGGALADIGCLVRFTLHFTGSRALQMPDFKVAIELTTTTNLLIKLVFECFYYKFLSS